MGSLETTDAESAAVQKTPNRVSLQCLEGRIAGKYYVTGASAVGECPVMPGLETFTICLLVMKNGFIVVGKAAPVDPENYDAEIGRKFAYEDAIRQVWPLEGYALRDRLAV